MGKSLGGPFYHWTGRVGNTVGRVVNGVNVIAMAAARGHRVPSEAQLPVQLKVKLVSQFLSRVSPFIRVGFEDHAPGMSAWNAAVQYNLENAVTGVYPALSIDYPQVLFSKGKLAMAAGLAWATTVDAQIDLSWLASVPAYTPGAGTDKLAVLVYNPLEVNPFLVSVGDAVRSDLSFDMPVPATWSGQTVYVYVSFVSSDGRVTSTTQFAGAVEVQ
ncbi:DUF6266 family protein [Pedobacter sp. JY14-1]|uniref:DUF6266 family protein n=1 Tax=Pedobacter sp. JY14-1 TaxID=3034151 RepID=UPI0023E25CB4|nr:DUF6266 family protein [Pedobacter sp. JY14-1]